MIKHLNSLIVTNQVVILMQKCVNKECNFSIKLHFNVQHKIYF